MTDKRLRSKAELKRLFTNLKRKGITDDMISILIDVLWREKPIMRSSGFFWPSAPDATIEWNSSTRTFTISPYETGGSGSGEITNPRFRFFSWSSGPIFHQKYETESIQLPDEEGLYVIYYNTDEDTRDQVLSYIKNPTFIQQAEIYLYKTIIIWIYWDQISKTTLYYGDERHGSEWVPDTHWWAHGAFNGIRDYGLRSTDIVIGDGSMNIHARVGVSSGAAWHEDLRHECDGIESTEGLPILYRTAFGPRLTSNAGFPVTGPHMGRIYFNYGGSLTETDEGRFVLCHIFWTNCFTNPLIAVMGQAQYDSAVEAIQGCADELDSLDEWVPHQTRLLITTLIYETKTEFANSVRARIVGEMTPESIADIVSEDNIPSLKTGWHPDVLEHIVFDYTEATHSMILDLMEDTVTFYFVRGIKFKVIFDLLFPTLQEELGMSYIDGDGNSWTETQTKWDEWETARVKAFSFYRNPRLSQTPYLGWRMHNWEMEGRTRGNIIQETGLEHLTGLVLSINETNDHEIDVTDGSLRLADIIAIIEHNSGNTFGQYLRSLRARRHWLKTYVDNTDPGNPATTHEWEYQDSPEANIASLSAGNQVVINELVEDAWQLTETADGDYSAMWLIGTLDYAQPLKWITGTAYSSDLDEAKQLNSPESLLSVIEGAQFITDHYEVIARVIIKNIADSPYYKIIEIDQYNDGEFDDLVTDLYTEDGEYEANSQTLILHRTGGLPDIEIPMELFSEMSIEGDGSPIFPFRLVNDQADPGLAYVYSTNPATGEKGWHPLYSSGGGSGSAGSGGAGSGSGSTPLVPGLLADKYVTHLIISTETNKIILRRSEGLPDLEADLPDVGEKNVQSDWNQTDTEADDFIKNKPTIPDEYENKDWTVITAKDIEAGTAQDYVIVMKARESFTINSLVYECDDGTLTGCAVKIDGVAVTGLSSLSVSTSETETSATGNNTVSAGNRITFHTSTGYTGTPTMINIQLNFTR